MSQSGPVCFPVKRSHVISQSGAPGRLLDALKARCVHTHAGYNFEGKNPPGAEIIRSQYWSLAGIDSNESCGWGDAHKCAQNWDRAKLLVG